MDRARVDAVLGAHVVPRHVAAPASLDGKPWRVGQWALYRTGGAVPGYERIAVVAIDACGMWILDDQDRYQGSRRYLMCFAPGRGNAPVDRLRIAILRFGTGAPRVFDFRDGGHVAGRLAFAPLVDRLAPPRGIAVSVSPRDDIVVNAGSFAQAVRLTEGGITRWIHPAVPLGGIVRSRSAHGFESVLLAYGERGGEQPSAIAVLAREVARAEAPPRLPGMYASFAFGMGQLTGHGGEATSAATPLTVTPGATLTRTLDVISEVADIGDAAYTPDPTRSQSALTVLLGTRWWPFRPPWLRTRRLWHPAEGLWLQADAGYAALFRSSEASSTTVARGLGLGAAVGWQYDQLRGFSLGIAFEDQVLVLDHGEGVRHALAGLFDLKLDGL